MQFHNPKLRGAILKFERSHEQFVRRSKHYLQVTDDHFQQAATKATTDPLSQNEAVRNLVQYATVSLSN